MPLSNVTLTNAVVLADGDTGALAGSSTSPFKISTGIRPSTALTATIATGASLSDVVTIPDGFRVDALAIPAGWTTANMTFQVSIDGTNFYDAYEYGNELLFYPIAGKATCLGPENSLKISKRYLKVRSGTAATAVAQTTGAAISLWLVSM